MKEQELLDDDPILHQLGKGARISVPPGEEYISFPCLSLPPCHLGCI